MYASGRGVTEDGTRLEVTDGGDGDGGSRRGSDGRQFVEDGLRTRRIVGWTE